MKKNLSLILGLLACATIASAQVPQMVNFSGVARDASGNLLINTDVMVQLTLIDSISGNSSVTKLYEEYQILPTNGSGFFSVKFGDPNAFIAKGLTDFDKIDWSKNYKVVNIAYDPKLKKSWLQVARFQLISFPYSFVAQKAMTSAEMTSTGANQGDELLYNKTNSRFEPGISLPFGTTVAWMGNKNKLPYGWEICNGRSLNKKDYPDLYNAIGTTWGNSSGDADSFNLPDLRGQFLRGVSENSNEDPDASARMNKFNGGNSGNSVGSYQKDTFKSHNHVYPWYRQTNTTGSNSAPPQSDNNGKIADMTTNSTGGFETRPKNANVYYIIRAKR